MVAILFLVGVPAALPAQATIQPESAWSALFGDQAVEFRYIVQSDQALKGRVDWSLTLGQVRKLALQSTPIEVAAGKTAKTTLSFAPPPVKDGVILEARLIAALFVDGQDKPAVVHEKTIWIYPRNPFADRQTWLKNLQITLFDPERKTTAVLGKLKVPFAETVNVAALGELKKGIVIVGEGTSFAEYRDLSETLNRAAANGVAVLCLAPAGGVLLLPGTEEMPVPSRIAWRKVDLLPEIDTRLQGPWPGERKVVRSSLVLKADEGQVAAVVTPGDSGWSWIEAHYATKQGRFVFCGFALVDSWEEGPAPRFLFARILERIDSTQSQKEPKP